MNFEELLDLDPTDWQLRGIYSDYLFDHNNPKLGTAQRFLYLTRVYPYTHTDIHGTTYTWISSLWLDKWSEHILVLYKQQGKFFKSILPENIFNKLPNYINKTHYYTIERQYNTRVLAEAALAETLICT